MESSYSHQTSPTVGIQLGENSTILLHVILDCGYWFDHRYLDLPAPTKDSTALFLRLFLN